MAADKDQIKLDVDWQKYEALDAAGMLHCVTARDWDVIGYHWLMVVPHMHYASTLMAFSDVFWIKPEYRKGWCGVKLFRFTEDSLKAKGVRKVFLPTKPHLDLQAIYRRLGYRKHETVYSKMIG